MDSSSEQEFSQIIENSLAAILSGDSTLESILARYPERSQELRAELEVALWLASRRDAVSPRPGFVTASRKRLVGRIKLESQAGSRSGKRASLGLIWPRRIVLQFASALTIFILLFLGTFGAVSAAQGAVPGDDFYSVKRLMEDVQYTFTLNPARRAQLSLEYSSRRLGEVELLIARGRYGDVAQTLKDFEYKVNQSVALLKEWQDANGGQPNALAEAMQTQLTRQTEQLNYLLQIAPPAAQHGLEQAMDVSQHGWQTASEMINKEPPSQTPNRIFTPPAAQTKLPSNAGNSPVKTVNIPAGQKDPNPNIVDTRTPRPTVEKKATNTDKPQPELKPEKPTKEEGNSVSPPSDTPPGQGKPPKEDPSNNGNKP